MDLNTEHTVVLTANECAALLAAAKSIMQSYTEAERDEEPYQVLISAAKKLGIGLGLSPKKAQQLSDFMDTEGNSSSLRNNPWGGAIS